MPVATLATMTENSLRGVAGTALGVARGRARESARPDRLFDDPLAAAFVEAGGGDDHGPFHNVHTGKAPLSVVSMYHWVVARTKFLDDVCTSAAADGIDQIVVLGAGLDTRAFRLGLPATADLYEIDRTDILGFKTKVLDDVAAVPDCRRHVVVADLASDWLAALGDAGFDRERRTLWLAEGLLIYLPADLIRQLLTTITAASPAGSRFGISLREMNTSPDAPPPDDVFKAVRTMWQDFGDLDVVALLAEHGWTSSVTDPRDLLVAVGRVSADDVISETTGRARLIDAITH